MAYRAGVHASTGKSPYEIMFGLRMRMPVHLLTQPYDDVDGDVDSDEEVEIQEDTRSYEEIYAELEQVRELIHESCAANISTAQAKQAKQYDARHRGAPLQIGDKIMNYNTKAKQRKGDRLAPNWTGPYTILKVHKNGNYSVANSKGEALTTKMCQSNVKLWQEPTNWESEPAPDWVSAQDVDYSDPTASPTSKVKRSKKSVASSAEPWIKPPVHGDESSSDEDYEGEPPVKKAEDLKVPVSQRKRELCVKKPDDLNVTLSQRLSKKRLISDDAEKSSKRVRFTDESLSQETVFPQSTPMDIVKNAVEKKVKKKRCFAEQRMRKSQERVKQMNNQKKRKDTFFDQMLSVNNYLPDLPEKVSTLEKPGDSSEVSKKEKCENSDSSDSDIQVLGSKEGDSFEFHPLHLHHRKSICQRVSLIMRKTEMAHSQVGEKLEKREPRVARVKGDGNCLFRALCVAITGWETGHMKIRQLVCDHIIDVGPYNSKDASDGPQYLKDSGMRKDTVYGTDVEIFSAAQVLSTDIYVYHKYGNCLKWLYFPCVHGSGNWKNAIYLDNRTGNGITGHFDYVVGLKL